MCNSTMYMWENGLKWLAKIRTRRYTVISDAGWSSPVARRAHNPKVVGSNPAPATP